MNFRLQKVGVLFLNGIDQLLGFIHIFSVGDPKLGLSESSLHIEGIVVENLLALDFRVEAPCVVCRIDNLLDFFIFFALFVGVCFTQLFGLELLLG